MYENKTNIYFDPAQNRAGSFLLICSEKCYPRAKMRENISHGCKVMRGKAPGRVACLEFAEGEKRTAITTDRAVEEILPRHYCVVME
jgi:hypothetical protein